MPGDLVVLENQLQPLMPHFAQVLGNTMPAERLIRTVVVSCERLPKLLECDRQSVFNAAMSAACLGLEVDGVTGQAFLIPFKGRAQLVIGYKGFNTLAARSGYTIRAGVVREGDEFEFDEAAAEVSHKRKLNNKGRIIAAWARAVSKTLPPSLVVLGIDDIMATKAKSPGAQRSDSPWNDPNIGFPAMAEKTAKRRLARIMPLNVMQVAARMDEAVEEQGLPARVTPDKGVVIDAEYTPLPTRHTTTPTADELTSTTRTRGGAAAVEAAPPSAPLTPESEGGAATIPDVPEGHELADDSLALAARRGMQALKDRWAELEPAERTALKGRLDTLHKKAALLVDAKEGATA